jgi:hypothetical protein
MGEKQGLDCAYRPAEPEGISLADFGASENLF